MMRTADIKRDTKETQIRLSLCLDGTGKADIRTGVGFLDHTELAQEFWLGFVRNCPASIHIRQLAGENTHHILEAVFKGMGRALKMAAAPDRNHLDEIPSTKGVL